MRQLVMILVSALAALIAAAQADACAGADPQLDEARAAYAAGRWREAAQLAGAQQDAEAQIFAAGALISGLLAEAEFQDRARASRQARRHAEAALRLSPEHPAAKMRLATAMGLQARRMTPLLAYMRGMPQRGRTLIEEAHAADPADPEAMALLGAWHLEVMRQAPEGALGASLEAGRGWYRAARRARPDDLNYAYHYALALTAIEEESCHEEARAVLDEALALPAADAYERALLEDARALAGLWEDEAAARAFAHSRFDR